MNSNGNITIYKPANVSDPKALFLDFDGVVAMDTQGSITTWKHVYEQKGLQEQLGVNFDTFYQGTYADDDGKARFMHPLEEGQIMHSGMLDDFNTKVQSLYGVNPGITYEDVQAGFEATKMNEPMLDLATRVKDAGYAVGMITDNPGDRMQAVDAKYGLSERFDPMVISADADVGTLKKGADAKQYDVAADKADVAKGQSVFIDNSRGNCEWAQHHGMTAIHFDDRVLRDGTANAAYVAKLEKELNELGFL